MTDPARCDWPRLIAELEQAGVTRYKLAQMLKPACQLVQVRRWADRQLWENGTEPSHWLGEQIRAIHGAYAMPGKLEGKADPEFSSVDVPCETIKS